MRFSPVHLLLPTTVRDGPNNDRAGFLLVSQALPDSGVCPGLLQPLQPPALLEVGLSLMSSGLLILSIITGESIIDSQNIWRGIVGWALMNITPSDIVQKLL